MTRSWLPAVALLALVAPSAFAGKHPVPLEPNVDAAKCLECHEDKTKGKVVHPAVAMGCFSCHFVRGSGDATRVVLKAGRPATLCFGCHDDKQPAKVKGKIHPPAQADCLKCHDPHVSANEKLLLKPSTGGKDENVCLSCHTKGLDVPKEGSRHAALDMGCTTCHITHKTGERGKQEFDFHLTKSTPALCLDCHDIKDKQIADAHQNQPLDKANCVQCHDPHQSKSPKLMQAFVHAPFEGGKDACATCHQPAQGGKVVLTQADSKALCVTCHEEAAKKIDSAQVAHPGAQGDCVSCHDPHAGKAPRFIKPNPVQACTACHSNQAEALTKKAVLHDPAFAQKCSICHEAHGGTREHLLRDETDALCLSCHAMNAMALRSKDGVSETIMNRAVTLPMGYVKNAPKIELGVTGNTRVGHPVPMHPVNGQDPRDPKKTITCVTCHDPHAGAKKNMLLSDGGSARAICKQCHEKEQSN